MSDVGDQTPVELIHFDERVGRYAVPAPSPALLAVLGLRRPRGQHTPAEEDALRRHARGRRRAVEIGVAEGVSARALRSVLAADGVLWLVDPYVPGALFGVNMARIVARRCVGAGAGPSVRWVRRSSREAVRDWTDPIDFLFVDGDHTYDGCRADVVEWSPHLEPGGLLVLHDARLFPGGWTDERWGSLRVADELLRRGGLPGFELVEDVDSLVIARRAGRRSP